MHLSARSATPPPSQSQALVPAPATPATRSPRTHLDHALEPQLVLLLLGGLQLLARAHAFLLSLALSCTLLGLAAHLAPRGGREGQGVLRWAVPVRGEGGGGRA